MIRVAAFILLFAPETAQEILQSIADSGRIVGMSELPSERLAPPVMIAPGAPPVLSFRYFEASERGRSANLGLVIDDAGH